MFAVGTKVQFKESTPQFAKNQGIVYVVTPSPGGEGFSVTAEGQEYLWLATAETAQLAPSRRRIRTGYVVSLEEVQA